MEPRPATGSRNLLGWIGWAGGDAAGRLILLSAATILLSRLVEPEDFGISAIVLAIAAAGGLLVGAPFEDALVQRRVLRKAHLRAALGFSLAIAALLCAAAFLLSPLLAAAYGTPQMALLMPAAMLSVLFSGHGDLATALARRRRRFNDIAAANLLAHAAAVPLAVVAATQGAGVWSFVVLRLAVVLGRSVVLQARVRYPLTPLFSLRPVIQLGRFAGISFLDRLADNLTYLAFNNLVGIFFGLTALGHVNMAMRLVEPVRGAVVAMCHNLAFPHFRRVALGADPAGAERDVPVALLAFVTAPVFAGLAAVMPLLLPLVAGPGWETATVIAICLSLGGAVLMPARGVYTALSAAGRPEYALTGNLSALAMTVLALALLRDAPPVAAGAARLAADGAQALFAALAPLGGMQWPRLVRLGLMAPAWIVSGLMALATSAIVHFLQPFGAMLALSVAVPAGVAVYLLLMLCLCRSSLLALLGIARGRPFAQSGSVA